MYHTNNFDAHAAPLPRGADRIGIFGVLLVSATRALTISCCPAIMYELKSMKGGMRVLFDLLAVDSTAIAFKGPCDHEN
jgi:hypothetical protein